LGICLVTPVRTVELGIRLPESDCGCLSFTAVNGTVILWWLNERRGALPAVCQDTALREGNRMIVSVFVRRLKPDATFQDFVREWEADEGFGVPTRVFTALIRLVGAVLAEQHDEWTEMRRYIGLDVLTRSRAAGTAANAAGEVPLTATTA